MRLKVSAVKMRAQNQVKSTDHGISGSENERMHTQTKHKRQKQNKHNARCFALPNASIEAHNWQLRFNIPNEMYRIIIKITTCMCRHNAVAVAVHCWWRWWRRCCCCCCFALCTIRWAVPSCVVLCFFFFFFVFQRKCRRRMNER